jgi:hypothetical protein
MPVIIDRASAGRLAAEGATCLDTDRATATRDGCPVPWPTAHQAGQASPILVFGSSGTAVRALAERLERQGLPAWQVVPGNNRAPDEGLRAGGPAYPPSAHKGTSGPRPGPGSERRQAW